MANNTIHMSPINSKASRSFAIGSGVVFLIIWLLAFISNPLVGPVGLFLTNTAHDMVHILSGVALLIVGFLDEKSALWGIRIIGIAYGIITLLGLFVGDGMLLGFIEMNTWDNLLHIIIAAVFLYFGYGVFDKKQQ